LTLLQPQSSYPDVHVCKWG